MSARDVVVKTDTSPAGEKQVMRVLRAFDLALALQDVEELIFPVERDYRLSSMVLGEHGKSLQELVKDPKVAEAIDIMEKMFAEILELRELHLDDLGI
jgi:hypothetical protein